MKKLIIANWKMNPGTLIKAKKLFNRVDKIKTKNKIVICPPFVYISKFKRAKPSQAYQNSKLQLGAQDCFWTEEGPYTGEISPSMLKDLRVAYVIIGHSERRALSETEEIIEKKLRAALKTGLTPILCVGEKKGENAKRVINNQLKKDLKGISKKDLKKVIIAYEPVWAIGTGNFCSANKANKVREFIKEKLDNKILYGGSVNSKIAKDYLKIGFDGLLIGNASLDAEEFRKIAKNA